MKHAPERNAHSEEVSVEVEAEDEEISKEISLNRIQTLKTKTRPFIGAGFWYTAISMHFSLDITHTFIVRYSAL